MPLRKILTNKTADNELFKQLSEFNKIKEEDLSDGKITILNKNGDSIFIDIADIFIFNSLIVNQEYSNSKDIITVSYKAKSSQDLRSLLVYFSNKFPNLVYDSAPEISFFLINMCKLIINRRNKDVSGEENHIFFVEQCSEGKTINITCNSDCFFKLDKENERFFFYYNKKMALCSMHFLNDTQYHEVKKVLDKLFSILEINIGESIRAAA